MSAVFTEYIKQFWLLVTIGIGNIAERERDRETEVIMKMSFL